MCVGLAGRRSIRFAWPFFCFFLLGKAKERKSKLITDLNKNTNQQFRMIFFLMKIFYGEDPLWAENSST